MSLGCPECGTLESHKHTAGCTWLERHPDRDLLDPIVTTHVLPEVFGWARREDIGPRVWELPDGLLFMFTPGMAQELQAYGRFVSTIEHEPIGLDGWKNSPEFIAKVNAEFEKGDWPGSKSCGKFFPERGHCAICDSWFAEVPR